MADDNESVRQRIISTVFEARLPDETYIAHIRIWESDTAQGAGVKPRFIIISSTSQPLVNLVRCERLRPRGQQWHRIHP